MAEYEVQDREKEIDCAYCSVPIRHSYLQYHLVKCMKNYKGVKDLKICPFNAKHHVPGPEYRHHMEHCPDKVIVEVAISAAKRKDENRLKGYTDNPTYKNIEMPDSENWDEEISTSVKRGPVYEDDNFKRAKFSDAKRDIFPKNTLQDGAANGNLRLPKTAPMVAMATEHKPVFEVEALSTNGLAKGQGRGRGNGTMALNGAWLNGTGNIPGIGRGLRPGSQQTFTMAVQQGDVAPPPGFCVPRVYPE